jgi:predicted phage terminase large subunit-like protein
LRRCARSPDVADAPLIRTPEDFRLACVDISRRRCEASLEEYVVQAWPTLEPNTPLLRNWTLGYICEHLEAVSKGQLTRVLINQPPRTLKSTTVTIDWPTWEWTFKPWNRWMFVSYADTLSTKHSIDRRTLIESPWYQERWGHVYRMASDQNVKTFFQNTKRGSMLATSINGSSTGLGGLRLVFDDPHNPKQALSDDVRKQAITNYQQTFYNRLDDKKVGAIVIVMQRLHQNDLSGHVLAEGGFTHVMIDNPAQEAKTFVFLSGKVFERPAGDLLDPRREGPAEIAATRKALGEYGFAGQYLQRPSPPGGAIFKRDWWQFYFELPGNLDEVVGSIDAAFKGKADSDNTAIQVWARKGANKYLVGKPDTERMTFPEAKRRVKLLRARFPALTLSRIYIEDKANGPAIIDDLKNEVSGLIAVNPEGGKEARAHAVSATVEAGNVFLPSPIDGAGNPRAGFEWVLELVELAAKFPKVENDDDIDAMTQALAQMQKTHDAWADAVRQQVDEERRKAEEERPPVATTGQPDNASLPDQAPPPPPPPVVTALTPEDAARALFG